MLCPWKAEEDTSFGVVGRDEITLAVQYQTQRLWRPQGMSASPQQYPSHIQQAQLKTDGDFTNHSIGSAAKRICHRQEVREQKRSVRRFESLD